MAPTLNRSLTDLGALLHLVDPTLPIGGFNHSNGLETFVQQGVVSTKASLEEYVQTQLLQNWIYNDGSYLSLAFDAMTANDFNRLCELDHSLSATKIARESREGSFKLGVRLLKIFIRYEQHPMLSQFQQAIQNKACKAISRLCLLWWRKRWGSAKRIPCMRSTTMQQSAPLPMA